MEFIKKLTKRKYFFVVLSFILILVFCFALHFTIENDKKSSRPLDDMPRAQAKVVNSPDMYTIEENGESKVVYANIQIQVTINENETYTCPLFGQVLKSEAGELDYGKYIKVKYSEDDHSTFYFANDPKGQQRVFLYVLYSLLIIGSIGGMIYSSKAAAAKTHKEVMEENIRRVMEQNEVNGGFDNSSDGVDVFDRGIDYNSMYQQDQILNDASYSADSTYSGYGSGQPQYDPNAPFTGYESDVNENTDMRSPGAPADSPYGNSQTDTRSPSAPFGSPYTNQQTYSGYGAPDGSMDTPYDPNAPYSGYGAPDASMDAPFDPNAPYSGYGAPNASMGAPFDPNAPYSGYGAPNASMDAPFDPNAPYKGY